MASAVPSSEAAAAGDEDEPAGRRTQKMLGRELDQRVLRMDGPEAAETGQEAEDQVLRDEAPREQADDGSDP
jgi:hypothetical protein